MNVENTCYTIVNMYGPNIDNPEFCGNLSQRIGDCEFENTLIGGDFNLTLNPELDRYQSKYNNYKCMYMVHEMMESLQLCDVWRDHNPDTKRYSWYRRYPTLSASRIDYFLTNVGLSDLVSDIKYSSCTRSDHSLVKITITNNEYCRGPGIWKLNTQLLKDEKLLKNVKNEILLTIQECNKGQNDAVQCWECIKVNCTEVLKYYSQQ